jgi:hypothetical protein
MGTGITDPRRKKTSWHALTLLLLTSAENGYCNGGFQHEDGSFDTVDETDKKKKKKERQKSVDQVPIVPKVTNICDLHILHFSTFSQYSLQDKFFHNHFEPIFKEYLSNGLN